MSIGRIIDHEGKEVDGPFQLKPNHMVQVISAEAFNLPHNVTGHVTYKTKLTRIGIWALTVGIVDPGWDGPISTTLLNFSRNDYAVQVGSPFLRVTFFEHDTVPQENVRKSPLTLDYIKDVKGLASTAFPQTFLNLTDMAEATRKVVMQRLRSEAGWWVSLAAILFALLQVLMPIVNTAIDSRIGGVQAVKDETAILKTEVKNLEAAVKSLSDQLIDNQRHASPQNVEPQQ